MPDHPSLFGSGDAEAHSLADALAGIERAISDNTRAVDDLADTVRRVLDQSTQTRTDAQPPSQPCTDRPGEEADPESATEVAKAAEEGARPEEPDPETETEQSAAPSHRVERKPLERPARFAELAGFEAAAVVGPGFVQIGAKRWAFEVHSAAEIMRIATQLQHPRSAPQIWVLTEVCEELGLVTHPDDVNRSRKERITSVERNLAELPAAAEFLAPALDDGWTAGRDGQLEAWTLLRSPQNKIAHVVLEPYTWMYDHDGRGIVAHGGHDNREYPNAIAGEPEDRADEILRRVRWISDQLGVLPDSNPGRTVQRMIDVDRRKRIKNAENNEKAQVDQAGRNLVRVATEHGRVPQMDGDADLDAVAPELVWPRIPSGEEVDAAEVAIELDQRYAYLATMSSTVFGVGDPKWVSAEEAVWTVTEGKPWFGVLRCEPSATWHEPRMFPPHPAMGRRRTWPSWIMGPAIDIAREDEDKGGAGWKLDDFGITGGYLWPDAGRLMEPFYKDMREALLKAEEIEDPTLRTATIDHLQGGYKSLTGKWEDIQILNSGHRTYRYQPMHRRQVIAATSARLFRQVRKLEMRHRGLWPVHAVTDGIWYLTTRTIADQLIEDGEKAKFGQLRPKRVHEVTDRNRTALHAMSPDDQIISVPHALNLRTAEKGR